MVLPALAACTGVGVTYRKSLAHTQNNIMENKYKLSICMLLETQVHMEKRVIYRKDVSKKKSYRKIKRNCSFWLNFILKSPKR